MLPHFSPFSSRAAAALHTRRRPKPAIPSTSTSPLGARHLLRPHTSSPIWLVFVMGRLIVSNWIGRLAYVLQKNKVPRPASSKASNFLLATNFMRRIMEINQVSCTTRQSIINACMDFAAGASNYHAWIFRREANLHA